MLFFVGQTASRPLPCQSCLCRASCAGQSHRRGTWTWAQRTRAPLWSAPPRWSCRCQLVRPTKRPATLQQEAGWGAGTWGKEKTYYEKICQKEVTGLSVDFSGCVPLFAGAAAAGKPVPNPDGARTIPGWLTLTGPSRLMMSDSLVLLA